MRTSSEQTWCPDASSTRQAVVMKAEGPPLGADELPSEGERRLNRADRPTCPPPDGPSGSTTIMITRAGWARVTNSAVRRDSATVPSSQTITRFTSRRRSMPPPPPRRDSSSKSTPRAPEFALGVAQGDGALPARAHSDRGALTGCTAGSAAAVHTPVRGPATHRRLHLLPSRLSSSAASFGPQLPAS